MSSASSSASAAPSHHASISVEGWDSSHYREAANRKQIEEEAMMQDVIHNASVKDLDSKQMQQLAKEKQEQEKVEEMLNQMRLSHETFVEIPKEEVRGEYENQRGMQSADTE